MKRTLSTVTAGILLLFLSSCAPSTLRSIENQGGKALNTQEIFNLTTNNTLRLVSSDFDSHVFFSADGSLSASSIFNNNNDFGSWDIRIDDKICLKFDVWYFGDTNCYSTYKLPEKDHFLMFTGNGALAYTVTAQSGNSQGLKIKTKNGKETVFVRKSLTKKQALPIAATPPISPRTEVPDTGNSNASTEEIQQTLVRMAQDCPGCNLVDADLRHSYLVGANLEGANLKGANLSGANLRRANLNGANLRGATLLSTNLPGANLKNADLSGVDLTGSNLIHADFTGADLSGCILKNTLQEGSKGL